MKEKTRTFPDYSEKLNVDAFDTCHEFVMLDYSEPTTMD